jgi:hypothetical protein
MVVMINGCVDGMLPRWNPATVAISFPKVVMSYDHLFLVALGRLNRGRVPATDPSPPPDPSSTGYSLKSDQTWGKG